MLKAADKQLSALDGHKMRLIKEEQEETVTSDPLAEDEDEESSIEEGNDQNSDTKTRARSGKKRQPVRAQNAQQSEPSTSQRSSAKVKLRKRPRSTRASGRNAPPIRKPRVSEIYHGVVAIDSDLSDSSDDLDSFLELEKRKLVEAQRLLKAVRDIKQQLTSMTEVFGEMRDCILASGSAGPFTLEIFGGGLCSAVDVFRPAEMMMMMMNIPEMALRDAADKKRAKYSDLAGNYYFVPLAFETSGYWGSEALTFVEDIGRRLRVRGFDARSGSYLAQRLSIAIQRGNAASVMGTFAAGITRGGIFD